MDTFPRRPGPAVARPPARLRPTPLFALLAVLLGLLAACGQATGADPGVATLQSPGVADASPSPTPDPQQAAIDYARCMREHGIDMPDPQVDSSGGGLKVRISGPADKSKVDAAKLTAAQSACQHFLSNAMQDKGKQLTPEDQDKLIAFARCMREHGVDMPDPDFSNGGVTFGVGGPGDPKLDPDSATFQQAQRACDSLQPGDGPKTTTGGGADTGPTTNSDSDPGVQQ
jgi:hypothetical protein